MNIEFNTPILLVVFNRPDTTRAVFDEIRKVRPKQLFIAADGPRASSPDDILTCHQTREIFNSIDWDCSVKTLFREGNLGCRKAVSSAISWFFENVEEGIVLEDDCLPHQDFFSFCESMLTFYRNEPRVMHISGDNFQFGLKRGEASYYFSRIAHIWGWATWRRAWKLYDVNMADLPKFIKEQQPFFINRKLEKYWLFHFKRMLNGANTWDYQWSYAVMKNGGYCVMPNKNLISNIGFGENATNAFDKENSVALMKTEAIGPIVHPRKIEYCDEADIVTVTKVFPIPSLLKRVLNKLERELKKVFK